MKKMLTLVLVSVLGGAITLGTYKTFLEKEEPKIANTNTQDDPVFLPTNYNTTTTTLAAAEGIDFTTAADQTVHAVVHVKNVALNTAQPTLQDLFYGRVPQKRQLGTGSGVIISPDGYIITNNHVIEDSEQLSITLNDNRTLEAKIVGTDPKTDIALLKVESDEQLPYTTFGDSDTAKIGEWVLAVGNPFNLTSTVTAGIISAKSRDLSGRSTQSFIQTDAAVNPGNSGGALVNTAGQLIGINTAISSQTGSYIGYSFAVPSNIAKKVVQDIMEFGNVQNGILGVSGGSLNSAFAEKLGIGETEGFYVDDVEEDTGAEVAGIKSGDIIKKIDNIKIRKFSDLRGFLDSKRPNDVVNITLLRDDQLKNVQVTLLKNNTFVLPFIGVIKEAKPEDLKKYKTDNGVKILRINGSYGQYLRSEGIEEGNIITAINNKKVNSIEDVEAILNNRDTYQPLSIELINSKGETNRYGLR
ncbi:PDZ domain-containing protein [Olleya aquimaris]|uniref:Trypsin-like peptidase domain-containing protein n=1 Tax=Olleya sediminilitoris TaxID=2795739 RepID=A0ABS1WLH0_9FLAO|nr:MULTISPECIES: trypsin-like peptidase domain-containing protein [Olleya]AXO81776.1 PDZ domain-containing protein [Olleya aquimaris]MBL7559898.1 trypsin-like peptidase domain-containing protein [Olleya sediminilitoris]